MIDFSLERLVAGHLDPDVQDLESPEWRLAALTLAHREIATWEEDKRLLVALLLALTERKAAESRRLRRPFWRSFFGR